jgi:hypothetical protein
MLLTNETTGWSAHKLSLEICSIFSNINGALVINETWMGPNIVRVAKTWLKLDKQHTVIFISLFDPGRGYQDLFTSEERTKIHSINSEDICFWLLAVDRYFLNYSLEQVAPVEFKYNFLCYQRKITEPRTYLYNQLKDKSGIVTIGDKKFNDINSNIPYHTGLSEVLGDLAVANDIWSLGNIEIWNHSFLNIVSETEQSFESDNAFLSEKILKPIVGLRPFLCFGHPNTTKLLKAQGFETFDEEFRYYPTSNWKDNADQLTTIVDQLDSGIFEKLKPKLLHNKNQLKIAAQTEWIKVNKLCEIYHKKVKTEKDQF